METRGASPFVTFTAESAQLEKALLEDHGRAIAKDPAGGSPDAGPRRTGWLSGRDFTIQAGKRQIDELIQTWELQPGWLYSLDFLYATEEEDKDHDYYHYRARFSCPTPRRPVLGTAAVYFAVGKPRVDARAEPVEVRFVVESHRLVHIPGETRFREQWLVDVIESKAGLGRAVRL